MNLCRKSHPNQTMGKWLKIGGMVFGKGGGGDLVNLQGWLSLPPPPPPSFRIGASYANILTSPLPQRFRVPNQVFTKPKVDEERESHKRGWGSRNESFSCMRTED